jgi:periplasmic copper chaperone A
MNLTRTLLMAVLLVAVAGLIAACNGNDDADPIVEDQWARPGEQGDNAAAYMVIRNDSDDDIRLTGASSDVARMVEVHESRMEGGVMRMEEMEEIVIPAGESVALEPGGYHVMFMNLERDLEPGDSFDLTLHFDGLDDVEIEVPVEEQ